MSALIALLLLNISEPGWRMTRGKSGLDFPLLLQGKTNMAIKIY